MAVLTTVVKGFHLLVFVSLLKTRPCLVTDHDIGGTTKSDLDQEFTAVPTARNHNTASSSRRIEDLKKSRRKRTALRNTKRYWPNAHIPYEMKKGDFDESQIRVLNSVMEDWERHTCLRFQLSTTNPNRVVFSNGPGCPSLLGFMAGVRSLPMQRECFQRSFLLHCLGHLIGLTHESSRPDRDKYIRVLFKNIPKSVSINFMKETQSHVNTYNVPYDFGSVMHYGGMTYSGNGQLTIRTINPRFQKIIGNRKILSFNDIKLVNLMYECARRQGCPYKTCPEDGFVGPDCNCLCHGRPVRRCDGKDIDDSAGQTGRAVIERGLRVGRGNETHNGKDYNVIERQELEACFNSNSRCEKWATSGVCDRNRNFMHRFCRKACGVCGNKDPIIEVTATDATLGFEVTDTRSESGTASFQTKYYCHRIIAVLWVVIISEYLCRFI